MVKFKDVAAVVAIGSTAYGVANCNAGTTEVSGKAPDAYHKVTLTAGEPYTKFVELSIDLEIDIEMFLRNLRFDSTYFDGVVDGIFLEDEEMSNLLDEAVSRVKARTENSESRDNVPSAQSVKNLIKDDSELLHG